MPARIARVTKAVVSLFCVCLILGTGAAQAAPVLVDSAWLEQHLKDSRVVIVDMTEDDIQYTRYHLPGAVRLSQGELLKPRVPGKPSVRLEGARFAALLGRLGIARESHVVIYDDMGGLNAGRLFLELEHIQHPAVSVLDGGLVKWVLDGKRVENVPRERLPVTYKLGAEQRANIATLAHLRPPAGETAPVLIDVRTREEYAGNPKEARSGHIPGAQWWPWEQSFAMDNGFVFHPADKLLTDLGKLGVNDKQAPVVLYCRSGHRASQSYLTLRQLGFENVRVYSGSMLDYLQDKNAPVTRGLTP